MHKIINGCIEVLEQGESFLATVTGDSYQKVIYPYFTSSSGEHMRHILDHFLVLMHSFDTTIIDYDQRHRGSNIETDRHQALKQLKQVKAWILQLEETALDKSLTIKTDVSTSKKNITQAHSSLARELIFASSHAVHHFSIISIAMQMQDISLADNFGVAPATATYLCENNKPHSASNIKP